MSEKKLNHDIRKNLAVYPETWRIVNREKLPGECFDAVLQRVFMEYRIMRDDMVEISEKISIQNKEVREFLKQREGEVK